MNQNTDHWHRRSSFDLWPFVVSLSCPFCVLHTHTHSHGRHTSSTISICSKADERWKHKRTQTHIHTSFIRIYDTILYLSLLTYHIPFPNILIYISIPNEFDHNLMFFFYFLILINARRTHSLVSNNIGTKESDHIIINIDCKGDFCRVLIFFFRSYTIDRSIHFVCFD